MKNDFLDPETREGYFISCHMKEVWAVQINLLSEFKAVCDKYGLKFYLTYGSLLGAIRHQGYIPWDDDIDITMPRDDYEKLKKISNEVFKEPYFYQTQENEEDFFCGGCSRLRYSITTGYEYIHYGHHFNAGIWIDITALDNKPNSYCLRKIQSYIIKFYQKIMFAKIYSRDNISFLDISSVQMKLFKKLSKLLTHEKICLKLNKWCCFANYKKTKNVGILTQYGAYEKQVYKADWFRDVGYMKFENLTMPVPVEYEQCLNRMYDNDYLKLPPLKERQPHHYGFYNTQKSYRDITLKFSDVLKKTDGKKIIIFGTGQMFENYMDKHGKKYIPSLIIDNDCKKWGMKKYSITIKSPKELLKIKKEKIHIIICSIYFKEIGEQLDNMGINDYYIYTQERQWVIDVLKNMEEDESGKV